MLWFLITTHFHFHHQYWSQIMQVHSIFKSVAELSKIAKFALYACYTINMDQTGLDQIPCDITNCTYVGLAWTAFLSEKSTISVMWMWITIVLGNSLAISGSNTLNQLNIGALLLPEVRHFPHAVHTAEGVQWTVGLHFRVLISISLLKWPQYRGGPILEERLNCTIPLAMC